MPSKTPVEAPAPTAVADPFRIAYLLADGGIPFSDSRKGGSIHARSMARAFQREGCDVDVYALRKGKAPAPGFSLHQTSRMRLTRWWLSSLLDNGGWRWLAPWRSRATGAPNTLTALGILLWQYDFQNDTRRQCRLNPPDLLYARHSWLSFSYARLRDALNAPLVLEVNAVLSVEKAQRGEMAFSGLTRKIERESFEAADLILPVSAELREQIISFGINPEKIMVMPNAVDLELFSPATDKKSDPNHFRIGFMHSFKPYHGMDILLAAIEKIRNEIPGLSVEVVGIGPEFESTKRAIIERRLESIVHLHGLVEHDHVAAILRDCDAGVAPYHGPHNLYGCPMKLYEYMAMKLPIVAAEWGDIPNIIQHDKTALLHKPGDADALARALISIHRDPSAAKNRAEAARELALKQSWQIQAQKILRRMRPLMEQASARRNKSRPAMGKSSERSFRVLQPESDLQSSSARKDWVGVRPAYYVPPSALHRMLFNAALAATAFILEPFSNPRRGNKKIRRPLQVLRVTSVLAQGGVAKVVVQSLLKQDPAEVQTRVLTFGKKVAIPAPLRRREGVTVQVERLELDMNGMQFRFFRDLFRLSRIIRRVRPDLIHMHEPQFAPVLRMAGALAGAPPMLVHLHSVYTTRRDQTASLQQKLERRALQQTPLIACSRTILDGAREWLGGLRQPIELIEDGADDIVIADEQDNLPEDLVRAANGRIVIAKMARLVPLKRIEDFLKACRALLDEGRPIFALLMAYGKDRPAAELRERFNAAFAPREGEFLFRVPAAARMLQHVDIGVSTSSLEGLGLNILEYQVAGVPVVCTDLPAHREMVEDGINGLLFPPTDVEALAHHLRRLLDDPALRKKLTEAGKGTAATRRWSDSAQKTTDFYHRILETKF